ncbi:hypothetical protein, partial [Mesorhizobium sp. M7A.T.Ca.TU.009.02.1.1]
MAITASTEGTLTAFQLAQSFLVPDKQKSPVPFGSGDVWMALGLSNLLTILFTRIEPRFWLAPA